MKGKASKEFAFEGQYSFGKIWKGLITKYNQRGKSIFQDQYLNGDKYGLWEEYDDSGNLIFRGNYLFGKRNGKAEEYDAKSDNTIITEYIYGYLEKSDNNKKCDLKNESLNANDLK